MAREIYDGDWMRQQPSRPLPTQSSDHLSGLAGPIAAGTRRPIYRYATRCVRDNDGDLVYGDDVRVIESEKTLTLPLPHLGTMTVRAKIFETSDKALLGHSIAYTAYPYSRNDRGRASFKRPSHHAKDNLWLNIEDQVREKMPLTRIIDQLPNDPFRTDGDTLRCYVLEPEQDQADLFSNRRASKSELQKALRWIQEDDDPDRDPNELVPDSIDDIILFGIVDDYDKAFSSLITHKTSQLLLNMADEGTLFEPFVEYRIKSMTDEAKNAAQSFLDLAAHNVLCGTYDPEAYRGYYELDLRAKGRSDAAPSIAPDANRGRSEERGGDQVRRYKQTLAVHLEHRFLDLMYNYNRAILKRRDFRPVDTSSELSHHADKAQAEGMNLEEGIHLVEASVLGNDKKNRAARRRLQEMIGSVRQAIQDLPDPDKIFGMLALTVALHQRNAAETESIDFVKSLPQLATDWDEDLQALIEEAVGLLTTR
jgi:hypothetical protein